MRDDVVGQMGRRLDHAPGGAGRTDAATLAGVGDEEVVTTVGAAGAGKAVREDAAVEVTAKFPLDHCRGYGSGAVIVQRQPRCQMRLHGAIEQRAFGLAAMVDSAAGRGAGGGGRSGGHDRPVRGSGRLLYAYTVDGARTIVLWRA